MIGSEMGNCCDCVSPASSDVKTQSTTKLLSTKDDDTQRRYLDAIRQQNYPKLVKQSISKRQLWEDPLFPAEDASVYLGGHAPYKIDWLRPPDILSRSLQSKPKFYVMGPGRFDLDQGELGDCWLVAATAAIADREPLIRQVIPDHDRFLVAGGFDLSDGYCGIFRFRLFHFGEWLEVCVDDRLPTFAGRPLMVHSGDGDEFWGALLEKAYAKLFGCYESLKAGVCGDAMTDLTGGLVENYRLKNGSPSDLADLLFRASRQGALICTGIWGDMNYNRILPNGLVTAHAYTITGVERLLVNNNEFIHLIRIRNPWGGRVEWIGRWSDRSVMWQYVSVETRMALEHKLRVDGEFWMDERDFVALFDDVNICHLTPDDLTTGSRKRWNFSIAHGHWDKYTGGGRLKFEQTFYRNPQLPLSVDGDENGDGRGDVVIELTQKWRRSTGAANLNIGFVLFSLSDDDSLPLNSDEFNGRRTIGSVDYYTNLRTVSKRFRLPLGRYVVVPTTWQPGERGEFMLRIWAESGRSWPIRWSESGVNERFQPTSVVDGVDVPLRRESHLLLGEQRLQDQQCPTVLLTKHRLASSDLGAMINGKERSLSASPTTDSTDVPSGGDHCEKNVNVPNGDAIRKRDPFICEEMAKHFRTLSGNTMTLSAFDLQIGLNRLYIHSSYHHFDINCCRALIALYDGKFSEGSFHWRNFYHLYQSLSLWERTFLQFKQNSENFLTGEQFLAALESLDLSQLLSLAGFTDRGKLEEVLKYLFADSNGRLSFSSFVFAVAKITRINGLLSKCRERSTDRIQISKTEIIRYLLVP